MKILRLLTITVLTVLTACGGTNPHSRDRDNRDLSGVLKDTVKYAKNIDIHKLESDSNIYIVTVRNPWQENVAPTRYVIVPRGTSLPSDLPSGKVIRTPIENALVYSSVHTGLISDLGAAKAIKGVCNAGFFTDTMIQSRLRSGEIMDCGNDQAPDIEKIIKLHPEIIMLSPFQNNDRYAKVKDLGVTIVECGDYMETSALGQAEWMKFYGLLFGEGEKARRQFNRIAERYDSLENVASRTSDRPVILMDRIYGQSWSVPGGKSTISGLITDAGGKNPFDYLEQSGGVELSPERVLARARNADIWLVRYNQEREKTLEELKNEAPLNGQFKAFREGKVYGCNTRYIPFFDQTPFHPDMLLEEFINIFHGSDTTDVTLHYFHRLE